jgi:hypothetical protein
VANWKSGLAAAVGIGLLIVALAVLVVPIHKNLGTGRVAAAYGNDCGSALRPRDFPPLPGPQNTVPVGSFNADINGLVADIAAISCHPTVVHRRQAAGVIALLGMVAVILAVLVRRRAPAPS